MIYIKSLVDDILDYSSYFRASTFLLFLGNSIGLPIVLLSLALSKEKFWFGMDLFRDGWKVLSVYCRECPCVIGFILFLCGWLLLFLMNFYFIVLFMISLHSIFKSYSKKLIYFRNPKIKDSREFENSREHSFWNTCSCFKIPKMSKNLYS